MRVFVLPKSLAELLFHSINQYIMEMVAAQPFCFFAPTTYREELSVIAAHTFSEYGRNSTSQISQTR